jgi:glucosyl-dolichyl phosphate glucuronosyltransferase
MPFRPDQTPDEEAEPASVDEVPTSLDVAVVVCAYTEERWDDIVEAIDSLQAQTEPAGEIVLVIDHNDALLKRAQTQFQDLARPVTILANTHKQGLSGARNTGIDACDRPIVAFLDDDAVADAGWVGQLVRHYADPNVVGVGGQINPIWLGGRPTWFPPEFDWVVGCIYKGHVSQTTEVRNVIGANMSVRRAAFEEVGGFSSGLGRVGKHPVGAEETELFIRARYRRPASKVIFEPAAIVGHKVPSSRGSWSYFFRRCYAEGLSKAIVAQISQSDENLSTERAYVLRALPLGALSGLKDGIKGDKNGPVRAFAIISGLFITTAGYMRGRLAKGPERNLTGVPSPAASSNPTENS